MPTSALVPERLAPRADDELRFAQRRRASWVALLVSRRWLVLAAWATAQWWIVPDHTGDWRYFDTAARAVFGGTLGRGRAPGGLHLYTSFPVQFGPPPILLAELARLGDGAGRAVFGIVIMCVCLPTLWLLQQTAMALGQPRAKVEATVLLGGLAIVPAWGVLAFGYTHMDDALVLFGAALDCGSCHGTRWRLPSRRAQRRLPSPGASWSWAYWRRHLRGGRGHSDGGMSSRWRRWSH